MNVGDRVVNVFTKREDVIERIGPCTNLNGEERVWLRREGFGSNGWSVESMYRCWEVAHPAKGSTDG